MLNNSLTEITAVSTNEKSITYWRIVHCTMKMCMLQYWCNVYSTVTEWELDNRHAPEYHLRLLEYYIRTELSQKGANAFTEGEMKDAL